VQQLSAPGWLQAGGRPLTQVGKLDVNYASNDMAVETILLGLEGFSDGAAEVDVSFNNAIPESGREVDFVNACINHEDVDLVFTLAGVALHAQGRILTASESSATKTPNALDVKFHGAILGRAAA